MAPLRIALSGVAQGPDLFSMMELLGREACRQRIRKAFEVLV
jgi:glutamyl-tRNA synthetase